MPPDPVAPASPPSGLDPRWLDQFAGGLAERPEITLPQAIYLGVFADAFPHRPRGDESRAWVLAALQHAAAAGVIRPLPPVHGKRWDRTLRPALPTVVFRIPPPRPPREEPWRRFPWDEQLAWVREMPRLTFEQFDFLQRVQTGLVQGDFDHPAPFKHRSLKLTDHEKRLGDLLKGALFERGRLTLKLLHCLEDVPPLAWESVNEEPTILVFENSGSFQTARQELRQLPRSPYGMVAYGSGRAFQRSVKHLLDLERRVSHIHYVGDLDRPGLATALAASRVAQAAGLPPVEPAPGLHRAMLTAAARMNHPTGWEYAEKDPKLARDELLLNWLPAEARPGVAAVLAAKRRVPEEVLGPKNFQALWAS